MTTDYFGSATFRSCIFHQDTFLYIYIYTLNPLSPPIKQADLSLTCAYMTILFKKRQVGLERLDSYFRTSITACE